MNLRNNEFDLVKDRFALSVPVKIPARIQAYF